MFNLVNTCIARSLPNGRNDWAHFPLYALSALRSAICLLPSSFATSQSLPRQCRVLPTHDRQLLAPNRSGLAKQDDAHHTRICLPDRRLTKFFCFVVRVRGRVCFGGRPRFSLIQHCILDCKFITGFTIICTVLDPYQLSYMMGIELFEQSS
jgi:hypothetical protein